MQKLKQFLPAVFYSITTFRPPMRLGWATFQLAILCVVLTLLTGCKKEVVMVITVLDYEEIHPPAPGVNYTHICFTDAQNGYVFGENSFVARTSDGGNSWQSLPKIDDFTVTPHEFFDSEEVKLHDASFFDVMHGLAVYGSNFYYTDNGAQSWVELPYHSIVVAGSWRSIATHNSGNGVIFTADSLGNDLLLLRTINSGQSWDTIANTANVSDEIRFMDEDEIVYLDAMFEGSLKTLNILTETTGSIVISGRPNDDSKHTDAAFEGKSDWVMVTTENGGLTQPIQEDDGAVIDDEVTLTNMVKVAKSGDRGVALSRYDDFSLPYQSVAVKFDKGEGTKWYLVEDRDGGPYVVYGAYGYFTGRPFNDVAFQSHDVFFIVGEDVILKVPYDFN